jgi:hypothetical protein
LAVEYTSSKARHSCVSADRGERFTLSANIDETQVVDGEVHAIHTELSRTPRNIQLEEMIENRNQQWMPGMSAFININPLLTRC